MIKQKKNDKESPNNVCVGVGDRRGGGCWGDIQDSSRGKQNKTKKKQQVRKKTEVCGEEEEAAIFMRRAAAFSRSGRDGEI